MAGTSHIAIVGAIRRIGEIRQGAGRTGVQALLLMVLHPHTHGLREVKRDRLARTISAARALRSGSLRSRHARRIKRHVPRKAKKQKSRVVLSGGVSVPPEWPWSSDDVAPLHREPNPDFTQTRQTHHTKAGSLIILSVRHRHRSGQVILSCPPVSEKFIRIWRQNLLKLRI